jgi:integrase
MTVQSRKRSDGTTGHTFTVRHKGKSWTKTFESLRQGREWKADMKAQLRLGRYATAELAKMLLRKAIESYLKNVTPHKAGRLQEARLAQKLLQWPLAERPLADIKKSEISALVRQREAAGISGSTIRKELSFLSQVFIHTVEQEHLELHRNPFLGVQKPDNNPPRDRRLTPDEVLKLRRYFRTHENPEMRFVFFLSRKTGLRRSELLRWKWRDVDFNRTPVWISVEQARKGKSPKRIKPRREFPILPSVVRVLKTLWKWQQDRLAGPPDKVITMSAVAIENARKRALKATGVKNWRLHDARHEAASVLYAQGLEQEYIRRILGHASLEMTQAYQTFREDEISKAFLRMQRGEGRAKDEVTRV